MWVPKMTFAKMPRGKWKYHGSFRKRYERIG